MALGWGFGSLRLEWELVHTVNDLKQINLLGISGDVDGYGKITSLLMNGYFGLLVKSKLTPFAGGGIGYSKIDVSDLKVRSIGYVRNRYLGMEDLKFETMKAEVAAHQGWSDFRFVF